MISSRIYLTCCLVGLGLFAACDDTGDPSYDASVGPALFGGGTGGATGAGGRTAGGTTGGVAAGGTTGGFPGAASGGMPGTLSGGIPGTLSGGMPGTLSGGTTGGRPLTGGTTGGTGGTTGGIGAVTGGTGGTTGGTGGTTGGTGGTTGGTGGTTGGAAGGGGTCPGLPAVTDFDRPGPFAPIMTQAVPEAGEGEGCTLFRPGANLGKDGFKHPIAVWGNGIITTPDMYQSTLELFASHGFVTIACNSSYPERPCLNSCMDWLVKQNASGPMAGKLDVTKEVTIGYSWGGGASIDTANRPNVKATVSFHGMPPRTTSPFSAIKGPLLLYTSIGDTFVSASGFVTPNYQASNTVPTFYATLQEQVDHLYILDISGAAAKERGPAIAWFRYWACGDQSVKKYFFGSDCTLCKSPWMTQKKPATAWQ
jgi:Dienelactone hydrolase family